MPVPASNLYGRIQVVLAGRGLSGIGQGLTTFQLQDDMVDGVSAPRIAIWNATLLGAIPTDSELQAVGDVAAVDAITTQQARKVVMRGIIDGLGSAVHKRFVAARAGGDTMTAQQWENLLIAEMKKFL